MSTLSIILVIANVIILIRHIIKIDNYYKQDFSPYDYIPPPLVSIIIVVLSLTAIYLNVK